MALMREQQKRKAQGLMQKALVESVGVQAMPIEAMVDREEESQDSLLAQVRSLQERALAGLTKAEAEGDLRAIPALLRECRSNIELIGRLIGQLQGTTVNVAVVGGDGGGLLRARLEALIAGARQPVVPVIATEVVEVKEGA